ncbi:MAG: LuxR C-terminal-related transcriptional regulator [Dehalococcoidia bacterium]
MTEEEPGTFGALLRHHRQVVGLSREALAERAELSAQAIGALERGDRRAPYPDTIRRLGAALALSPTDGAALAAAAVGHRRPPSPHGPARIGEQPTAAALQPDALALTTTLVGRTHELADIIGLLTRPEVRLITFTGPAGVGKTSLAIAAATHVASQSPQGVAFIDLSPVRDPAQVLPTIATRLGRQTLDGRIAPDGLGAALRDRVELLVLDNFEQVLPAATLLSGLLAEHRTLTVLVTSREALQLRAEQVYQVRPLACPDPRHLPPLQELGRIPSVALFLQRVQALDAGFVLTAENAAAVAELCMHLDGLPLAIELAAARTPAFSPRMILDRLTNRLALLRWEAQDLPERQHTLRAAIGWSYALLDEAEQVLFCRLGVFAGSFTLEAAEAMAGHSGDGPGLARRDSSFALDLLGSLVAKNLVLSEADASSGRRFRLLESMRDYALEQLEQHGDALAAWRAHAAFYVALAERAETELTGAEQRTWFLRMELEHEELRAALRRLGQAQEGGLQLRLATALAPFWGNRGFVAEERRWLEEALAHAPDASPHLRVKALNRLGALLVSQGDPERAQAILGEALALAREVKDLTSVARALAHLGRRAARSRDWHAAQDLLSEALTIAQEAKLAGWSAYTRQCLGAVALMQGQRERAEQFLDEALAEFWAAGDNWLMVGALNWLVIAIGEQGDVARAIGLPGDSRDICQVLRDRYLLDTAALSVVNLVGVRGEPEQPAQVVDALDALRRPAQGDEWFVSVVLNWLAIAAGERGDVQRAATLLSNSLALSDSLLDSYLLVCTGETVAWLARDQGDPELVARLAGALDSLRRSGDATPVELIGRADEARAAVHGRLPPAAYEGARASGRRLSFSQTAALTQQVLAGLAGAPLGSQESVAAVEHPTSMLSPRDHEVLRLIAAGLSNKDIAARLVVAERTVKYHVTTVFNKLGVGTRAQAVAVAVERGFL